MFPDNFHILRFFVGHVGEGWRWLRLFGVVDLGPFKL